MKKIKYRRFAQLYLYSRRLWLIVLALFFLLILIMAAIFEDAQPVLAYLSLLLFFLTAFALLLDIWANFKAYYTYYYYEKGCLNTPLERELFSKIKDLEKEQRHFREQEKKRANDLMDYYTLWVHQIKTPIAASSLLIADLEKGSLRYQLEQELFKIEAYANIVLQYLRLESFHEDVRVEKIDLEPLIRELVKKYASFFIHKGLRLNLHDVQVKVITDRKWFLIILEQILSNSLKYTTQGEIEIFVAEGNLFIRDTGLGIKTSDLNRVFERGFSGYNGRLTQQSSGLGLYLSKQVAQKLGHSLDLESQLGHGTTAKIGLKREDLLLE